MDAALSGGARALEAYPMTTTEVLPDERPRGLLPMFLDATLALLSSPDRHGAATPEGAVTNGAGRSSGPSSLPWPLRVWPPRSSSRPLFLVTPDLGRPMQARPQACSIPVA